MLFFVKVVLIFGVTGACRGIEMTELSTTEINDWGSSFLVTIKNTKNKTDRTFLIKNQRQQWVLTM